MKDRLRLLPLRVRLVAVVLLLASLALAGSAVLTTGVLRGYLVNRVDTDLVAEAQSTPGLLEDRVCADLVAGRPGLGQAFSRGPGRGPGRGGRPASPLYQFYVLYVDANGQACSADSTGERPELPEQVQGGAPFTAPSVGSDDGSWRVVQRPVGGGTVTLATSLSGVDETVRRLLVVQALVALVMLAGLAALAYVVVRQSLKPLREVEQTSGLIAAGDLSLRVPREDGTTEVGRLATAFNAMIERIQSSFQAQEQSESEARESEARMRRFVGDASHELRTPLTSIRGFAELYRVGAVPPGPDLDRVMGRVEGEAQRMGELVEELLLLARLDQHRPLDQVPVDLYALAVDAVHDAAALGLAVTLIGAPVTVRGDQARLRQVLVNLLGNARTHTPEGTRVRVDVHADGGLALLSVADDGPGLAPEQAARVFERFYRGDASRTRASGGTGLGLSIVAAVAHAHGGRAGVLTTPGGGATFTVELPLP